MNGGGFIRVLATLALIGVLVAIGVGVYNAGVSQGIAQQGAAVASGAPVVVYPGPYVGHWGWGFGFFGIFFWIMGIFLIFALIRAAFGFGRGGKGWTGRHGYYGRYGNAQDHLEDWHRRAHDAGSGPSGGSGSSGTTPA